MSKTTVTYPMVAALFEASKFLKSPNIWYSNNDTQKQYIEEHHIPCSPELKKISEIKSMASTSSEEINVFLKDNGFSIHLEDFEPGQFGTAAVLNVLVEWVKEGLEELIIADGKNYPGVYDEDAVIFESPDHKHPIAKLETKSGDIVYMTIADGELENLDLISRCAALSSSLNYNGKYSGCIFPMVQLDQEVDISWMIGISTLNAMGSDRWKVQQALQQTKFRMNRFGARAESAVAFGLECCSMAAPPMVIDKPFLVWITRPGLTQPLFAGYITQEDWKDPGTLD